MAPLEGKGEEESMEIRLMYQLADDGEPRELAIAPEDYFDPIENNDSYWDDAVERCLFLHDYLDTDPARLRWIVARLSDSGRVRLRRALYLDGCDVTMEHLVEEDGDEEIILGTLLPDGDWHIVRVRRPRDGAWTVTMNSLAGDEPVNGKYPSRDLCKNWSFEELIAFSTIGLD